MLFTAPPLDAHETEVLAEVDALRERLRWQLHEPRRWYGSLRRVSMARAIQGSNSIEGYDASLDDAAAVDLGEEPLDADEETRLALKGYRDAMTYVLQMALEPDFTYSDQLIKSLHFMMTSYDLKVRPGLWRAGSIFVFNEEEDRVVYEGADVELVPGLMRELVEQLNDGDDGMPAMIRAAMAHLNLVMIHPFRDGNGRMARCLQTLVLSRENILMPVFCSIEEYLGRNTQVYYDMLAQVGRGRWNPGNDTRPWVRFTLTAHLRQARTMVQRIKDSELLWGDLETFARQAGLHERTIPALFDAAIGFRVRNSTYRAIHEDEITEATASRDLRHMVEAGALAPKGERRGRYYIGTKRLIDMRQRVVSMRDPKDDRDPFQSRAT